MSEIKSGDIMLLQSGGPTMTVEYVNGDTVRCVWFDGNHELHREEFNKNSLRKSQNQAE